MLVITCTSAFTPGVGAPEPPPCIIAVAAFCLQALSVPHAARHQLAQGDHSGRSASRRSASAQSAGVSMESDSSDGITMGRQSMP